MQLVSDIKLGFAQALHSLQAHPKRVMAAVGALLLGCGATAFAVATWVPAAQSLPVAWVTEPVQVGADSSAADRPALAQGLLGFTPIPFTLYRSEAIRATDSAETLLRRLGVVDAGAVQFIKTDALARNALLGKAGRLVSVETDDRFAVRKLTARWTSDDSNTFQRFVMERKDRGITARIETDVLQSNARLASGVIRSSLFAATDEARIPDTVAVQLAEIFSTDIDFIRDLRKGDVFNVVYEALEADGEPLRAGRVLAAQFINGNTRYDAAWFQEPGQKGQYYTLAGNSLRKAFLASPLEFSRVTSGFGGRVHPLAKQWRMHTGVDYAAPTGTPVRTVGEGVIEFAGVQGGYGNVVEVMHQSGKSTVYAHLSKINVHKGQKVSQGDVIGAVGTTGWSTGPHLHFEFRIAGVHHDPMDIAKQAGTVPISASARPTFERLSAQLRRQLDAASSISLARAQ